MIEIGRQKNSLPFFYDLDRAQARGAFQALGLQPFVLDQVWQWVYEKNCQEPDEWSNVSKKNRSLLADHFSFELLERVEESSADSGEACKLLLRLHDGNQIECVLIKERGHVTYCLSSQAGCSLDCLFCATGQAGFRRNLSQGEILGQFLQLQKQLPPGKTRRNVVFMGMGEPLLNLDSVLGAIGVITGDHGPGLATRRITLSTVGEIKALDTLQKAVPGIKTAISLNAVDQEMRSRLMPGAARQNLDELLDYLRRPLIRHRYTMVYVLLAGINDDATSARRLVALVRGIPCKINLVPFNPVPGIPFETPGEKEINKFQEILAASGLTVLLRWSKGRNCAAACGQLAR